MKKIISIIIAALVLFSVFSCKEEFDYNQMTSGLQRLVVEGYITDVDSVHTIKLMRSSDYIEPQPALPANGASVIISDGSNIWSFAEISAGIYQNTVPFYGEIGKTYELNISYENENYTASSIITETLSIDESYVYYEDGYNLIIICAQESETPDQYYSVKLVLNEVMDDSVTNLGYFDDQLLNGMYMDMEVFGFFEGEETDTVGMVVSSISKEFYEYCVNISENINVEPDPFFSTTPANFKGNISNGGLGFFQASSVISVSCERL